MGVAVGVKADEKEPTLSAASSTEVRVEVVADATASAAVGVAAAISNVDEATAASSELPSPLICIPLALRGRPMWVAVCVSLRFHRLSLFFASACNTVPEKSFRDLEALRYVSHFSAGARSCGPVFVRANWLTYSS